MFNTYIDCDCDVQPCVPLQMNTGRRVQLDGSEIIVIGKWTPTKCMAAVEKAKAEFWTFLLI